MEKILLQFQNSLRFTSQKKKKTEHFNSEQKNTNRAIAVRNKNKCSKTYFCIFSTRHSRNTELTSKKQKQTFIFKHQTEPTKQKKHSLGPPLHIQLKLLFPISFANYWASSKSSISSPKLIIKTFHPFFVPVNIFFVFPQTQPSLKPHPKLFQIGIVFFLFFFVFHFQNNNC